MKYLKELCLPWLLLLIVFPLSVKSSEIKKVEFEGVDISPFVNHYKLAVKKIRNPFVIYNWSGNGSHSFWNETQNQNDPQLLNLAKKQSQSFWRSFGVKEGDNNMYGYGLYAAADPLASRSFGGSEWVLLEMKISSGFRIVDMTFTKATSDEFINVAQRFNCPSEGRLDVLFTNGGSKLDDHCKSLVRKVFEEVLAIDGFSYPYSATIYKHCENEDSSLSQRAFVITKGDWMTSENIKYYTKKMDVSIDDRIRIQTLLLSSNATMSEAENQIIDTIALHLTKKPGHFVSSSNTTCKAEFCSMTIRFCDSATQNDCEDVKVGGLPRPGGPNITAAEAMKTWGILWPELEGVPKSTTISIWLNDNKYGCSGKLPTEDIGSRSQR